MRPTRQWSLTPKPTLPSQQVVIGEPSRNECGRKTMTLFVYQGITIRRPAGVPVACCGNSAELRAQVSAARVSLLAAGLCVTRFESLLPDPSQSGCPRIRLLFCEENPETADVNALPLSTPMQGERRPTLKNGSFNVRLNYCNAVYWAAAKRLHVDELASPTGWKE